MKITLKLSQEEINVAISQYVATQGLSIENKAVSIEMVSGRKGNSNYATIELTDREATDADRQEAYDNVEIEDTSSEESEENSNETSDEEEEDNSAIFS